MQVDDKHVITGPGIVLWDGITNPGSDDKTGATIHSLKIAIVENSPEKAELEALANAALASNPAFNGQLPPGGEWPIRPVDVSKMPDDAHLFAGRVAINANTRLGAPHVFDANGNTLTAMQYGRMFYPGAIVKMMVHAYSFNNKSKGVAYGLDAIEIVDATAPHLSVGGGMGAQAAAAAMAAARGTGGHSTGAPQPVSAPTPAPISAPAPAPDFVANAGKVMLPAAQYTYEQYKAAGWTDEQMIAAGYLQG